MQVIRIGFELVQSSQQRVVGEQRVAEGNPHVAQYRRVGKVALPARDRQLLGKMAQ